MRKTTINWQRAATELPPTLSELGGPKTDSSRRQAVASLPEERIERHLAEAVAADGRLVPGLARPLPQVRVGGWTGSTGVNVPSPSSRRSFGDI